MKSSLKRRQLLKSGLAASAALAMPTIWSQQTLATTANLQWLELDENLALVRGAGGNVLVGKGLDGVMMVDGGRAEHSEALLQLIDDKMGQRPSLLFNTHWHWDHTGSNETLGKAGATIIAHENTRLWLTTEVISKWENKIYPPAPKKALPNQTFFYDSETINFNGGDIEYGYLRQAHTDGDVYVRLPKQNIIVIGDVASGSGYPIPDYCSNGWLGGMIQAVQLVLEKSDADTRFIAGTGEVLSRKDLEAQVEMGTTVLQRIAENYYASKTYAEFIASKPTEEFDVLWGDPSLFLETSYKGVAEHLGEARRFGRDRRR